MVLELLRLWSVGMRGSNVWLRVSRALDRHFGACP